jgi:hypothetical protein
MKTVSRYALAYLLWALTTIAMVVVALLARDALMNSLAVASTANLTPGEPGAFDVGMRLRALGSWTYPIIGVILVVAIVFLEHHYRTAPSTPRLLARFIKTMAITLIVLFVGHLVLFIASRSAGVMGWAGAWLPALELAVVALLFALNAWLRRHPANVTAH